MLPLHSHLVRRVRANLALTAVVFCVVGAAHAQATISSDGAPAGRLNFEAANLPAANVEVDLSQEMFKDLFGIGDAAIAGVAETLLKSANAGESAQGTRLAAEQLEAARLIVQLAGNVVREVRVRVYESLPEGTENAQVLFKPFDEQLQASKWETLVRVRDDDNTARVSVLRSSGTVQGIFVVASDGGSTVLANVVCEVSPDNIKKLTSAATKIGLENGLSQVIEAKMKRLPGAVEGRQRIVIKNGTVETTIVPPSPPSPPAPPAAPKPPADKAVK